MISQLVEGLSDPVLAVERTHEAGTVTRNGESSRELDAASRTFEALLRLY